MLLPTQAQKAQRPESIGRAGVEGRSGPRNNLRRGTNLHSYHDLPLPPQKALAAPQAHRLQFPNGLTAFLAEDHDFPVVDIEYSARAGSLWDPRGKAGLADILARTLEMQATGQAGDPFDPASDPFCGSLTVTAGPDLLTSRASVPSPEVFTGLSKLADLFERWRRFGDWIRQARSLAMESLARDGDDSLRMILRIFRQAVYGAESPYGDCRRPETIANVTVDDLRAFCGRFLAPQNSTLAIAGDFTPVDIIRGIEQTFGRWSVDRFSRPDIPECRPSSRGGQSVVHRAGSPQTWLLLGSLGGRVDDPDYPAMLVLNHCLGGGGSSRLAHTFRSRHGLAYRISSEWSAGWEYPGLFMVLASTRPERTTAALKLLCRELKDLAERGPGDCEIEQAKCSLAGTSLYDACSAGDYLSKLAACEHHRYPADVLSSYARRIADVTADQLRAVAASRLKHQDLIMVIVGDETRLDRRILDAVRVT